MPEDVLTRLARANPTPDGLTPPSYERIYQRIQDVGKQQDGPADGWTGGMPRLRRARGALALAVSIGLAVAVAVAAVVLIGHRTSSVQIRSHGSDRQQLLQNLAVLQQLLQNLAVLRRSQDAADRAAINTLLPDELRGAPQGLCRTQPAGPRCGLKLDERLVRALRPAAPGYRAAIFPIRGSHQTRFADRGLGLALSFKGPGVIAADSGYKLATVQDFETGGVVASSYVHPSKQTPAGVNVSAILVPDSVDHVTLQHIQLINPKTRRRLATLPDQSASVHNNLAFLRLDGMTESHLGLELAGGPYGTEGSGTVCTLTTIIYTVPAVAQEIWQTASHQSRTTTLQFSLYVVNQPVGGVPSNSPKCRS